MKQIMQFFSEGESPTLMSDKCLCSRTAIFKTSFVNLRFQHCHSWEILGILS